MHVFMSSSGQKIIKPRLLLWVISHSTGLLDIDGHNWVSKGFRQSRRFVNPPQSTFAFANDSTHSMAIFDKVLMALLFFAVCVFCLCAAPARCLSTLPASFLQSMVGTSHSASYWPRCQQDSMRKDGTLCLEWSTSCFQHRNCKRIRCEEKSARSHSKTSSPTADSHITGWHLPSWGLHWIPTDWDHID